MKKLFVPENNPFDNEGFKPKHIEISEEMRDKLNRIIKVSKKNSTTKVIKTWLQSRKEDLY